MLNISNKNVSSIRIESNKYLEYIENEVKDSDLAVQTAVRSKMESSKSYALMKKHFEDLVAKDTVWDAVGLAIEDSNV